MDAQTWIAVALNILAAAAILAGWMYYRTNANTQIAAYVAMIAKAAEQQFLDHTERRAWAMAHLREKFPRLQADLLIALLEAAVLDINHAGDQATASANLAAAAQTMAYAQAQAMGAPPRAWQIVMDEIDEEAA